MELLWEGREPSGILGSVTDAARRIELSDADEDRLLAAHRKLAAAAKAYDRFLGKELVPGQAAPLHDADEMRAAQEAVQATEDELWRLREELLGWVRPSWVPSAALTADWFSDEDAIYDDLPETTSP